MRGTMCRSEADLLIFIKLIDMVDLMKKYGYVPDRERMDSDISRIAGNLETVRSEKVLKDCFSVMDLTSLRTNDTPASIERLVRKVNDFPLTYPDWPLPASVCVYPNFAGIVRQTRKSEDVHVTVVAGCFPSSQSYLEVKVRECGLAVENGADEVDIVLALNAFLDGDYDSAAAEIVAVRNAVDRVAASCGRKVILKVILETGLLGSAEAIAEASFLAMESGADFIKTSTGKVDVNATPAAAYTMCECIRKYHEATGRKVGFKPAGGISTAMDAISYYSIVSAVLGSGWLDKSLFRLGVSRLANGLLSEVEQKTVNWF